MGTGIRTVLLGDRVVAVAGSRLFVYDAKTDEAPDGPVWSKKTFYDYSMPAYRDGRIHLTDRNGAYVVLRADDGQELLSHTFGSSGKEAR